MECPNCHINYDDELLECPGCGAEPEKSDAAQLGIFPELDINAEPVEPGDDPYAGSDSEREIPGDCDEKEGGGGFGKILLVSDVNMFGRKVAIKRFTHSELGMLAGSEVLRPEFEEKILEKAKDIANLKHPNVVDVYFAGKYQEGLQIVMEYIEGGDLEDAVTGKGRIDSEEAARIGVQLCDGISALHENDIVHGCIRPENILFTKEGVPKIIGFNYASDSVMAASRSKDEWSGPEQREDRTRAADVTGDIYSLGAVLYFAVTGEIPGETVSDKLPETIGEHILGAMAENPDNRFSSVREFGEALENVLISRRKLKIISEGEGEFPCYECGKDVPYAAAFCPACGVEILGIWKKKETLYRDSIKEAEELVRAGEFNNALKKLDTIEPEFDHEHFVHLKSEIETKKQWVQDEWNRVDDKKDILLGRIRKAESALERLEFKAAMEIAEEIKQSADPYFKSIHTSADKIIEQVGIVRENEKAYRDELAALNEAAEEDPSRFDFAGAKNQASELMKKIDQSIYPEIFEEARKTLERIAAEEKKADNAGTGLRVKLDDAAKALENLDFEKADLLAAQLEEASEEKFPDVFEDAGKIRNRIARITDKRKNIEQKLEDAEKSAANSDYTSAVQTVDEILALDGEAYEDQRQKAAEAKEKFEIMEREYETARISSLRLEFGGKIEEAKNNMFGASSILRPVMENEDGELENLRGEAAAILKKRTVVLGSALGVLLFLLIVGGVIVAGISSKSEKPERQWGFEVRKFTPVVNVRTGPDTSFDEIETLKKDESIEIRALGYELSQDGHPWIKVSVKKAGGHPPVDGYISGKIIEDMNGNLLFSEAAVIGDGNVRDFPDKSGRPIAKLGKDFIVSIKGKAVDGKGRVWFMIHQGQLEGYIQAGAVRLVPLEKMEKEK